MSSLHNSSNRNYDNNNVDRYNSSYEIPQQSPPIESTRSSPTTTFSPFTSDDENETAIGRKVKLPKLKFPFHYATHKSKKKKNWRFKLGHFIESNRVQSFIIALILLDLIIVIVEIFLEEHYKKCKEEHEIPHAVEKAEHTLHIITLVILGIFELEVLLLLIAFGRDFFKHPLYILDAVIVTVSIVVDTVFKRDTAGELIVIFRLWRLVRIGHAIAVSVESHDKKKYKKLKKDYKVLQSERDQLRLELNKTSQTSTPSTILTPNSSIMIPNNTSNSSETS
eukprot:gene6825-8464_t